MKTRLLLTLTLSALLWVTAACSPATTGQPVVLAPGAESDYLAEPTEAAEFETITEEGAPVEPPDMFFEDYGSNPFVPAAQDNLSTFAVDVDTGAYTLTRSYLTDYGQRPPAEAVRTEEFINYFDAGYAPPTDTAFALNLDAAQTPYTQQNAFVLRVGVQGYAVPDDQRPDANLYFVIDISGSMNGGNRLGAVKSSLESLVRSLRPTDTIGIVVYGSNGRVLLQPTSVADADRILRAINQLQPDGSTNAVEGLRLGYDMANANFDPARINRIILCSDGVANVGITGPQGILETVREQAIEGINLTTVGFGMGNYNDVLMEQLANDGDGQYFYVDTPDESRRVFVDGLTGTLLTIARDARIQVEFNPETVEAYRLLGYENRAIADEDFRNDEVDAGEIGSGHTVTALYEIIPIPGAQGTFATARLRWEAPDTRAVEEIDASLALDTVTADFTQANPYFQLAVYVAAFAEALGDGGWAQVVDLPTLAERVAALEATFPNDPSVPQLRELITLAHQYR